MMQFTLYDGLMTAIVLYAVLQGAWQGMAWQVAPIASLIAGYILAYPMSDQLAPMFGEPPTNKLFALVVSYLVISLAVYLIFRAFRESIDRLKLTEFDRHLGALFGLVKGLLFTVALTLGLILVSPALRGVILRSESSTIANRVMQTIYPILPTTAQTAIDPYVKKIREQIPQDIADENPLLQPQSNDPQWPSQYDSRPSMNGNADNRLAPTGNWDDLPPRNSGRNPPQNSFDNFDPGQPPRSNAGTRKPQSSEPDPFEMADPNRPNFSPRQR